MIGPNTTPYHETIHIRKREKEKTLQYMTKTLKINNITSNNQQIFNPKKKKFNFKTY
jgi:hypothetical protein